MAEKNLMGFSISHFLTLLRITGFLVCQDASSPIAVALPPIELCELGDLSTNITEIVFLFILFSELSKGNMPFLKETTFHPLKIYYLL